MVLKYSTSDQNNIGGQENLHSCINTLNGSSKAVAVLHKLSFIIIEDMANEKHVKVYQILF